MLYCCSVSLQSYEKSRKTGCVPAFPVLSSGQVFSSCREVNASSWDRPARGRARIEVCFAWGVLGFFSKDLLGGAEAQDNLLVSSGEGHGLVKGQDINNRDLPAG